MICVLERREVREEYGRVNDTLAKIRRDDEDVVFPDRIIEAEGGYKGIANCHAGCTGANECDELAVARDDEACDQAADRIGQRWNGESGARFGSRVE